MNSRSISTTIFAQPNLRYHFKIGDYTFFKGREPASGINGTKHKFSRKEKSTRLQSLGMSTDITAKKSNSALRK